MELNDVARLVYREWSSQTEFTDQGNRYVAYVLSRQIDELIEQDFSDYAMQKELADMALVILRYYQLKDLDPEDMIVTRLLFRHKGKVAEIVAKYLRDYPKYIFRRKKEG